jgi:predicted component of type VI protein secretion system
MKCATTAAVLAAVAAVTLSGCSSGAAGGRPIHDVRVSLTALRRALAR